MLLLVARTVLEWNSIWKFHKTNVALGSIPDTYILDEDRIKTLLLLSKHSMLMNLEFHAEIVDHLSVNSPAR